MRVQVTASRDHTPQGHVTVLERDSLASCKSPSTVCILEGMEDAMGRRTVPNTLRVQRPSQKPQESCCPGVGGGPPSLSSSSKCLEGPGRSGEDRQAGLGSNRALPLGSCGLGPVTSPALRFLKNKGNSTKPRGCED